MNLYDVVEFEGFGVIESPIKENSRVTKHSLEEAILYLKQNRKDKNLSWSNWETPYTYIIEHHVDGKLIKRYSRSDIDTIIITDYNKSDINDIITNKEIGVYLLNKYSFTEPYKLYFRKDAPGYLGYWIHVDVDLRFSNDYMIKGVRGEEQEQLFRGDITTLEELETILKLIKVI